MAIKLVRNNDGTYEYVDAASQSSKVNNLKNINNDFEAYESNQKTSLNQSTDIGTQTGQLIREMPGQTTTRFNDQTGQFETTTATQAVNVEGFKEPERTAESTALTPMQQVERLTAATRPDSSTTSTDKVYELMARQQKLAEKTQQFNKLYKGADLAFRAYDTFTDFKKAGRLNIVPMKGGSTLNPISGFMGTNVGASTVGGVGRTVICTELYKQNLMSKENHRLSWNFTINNFSDTHINGYWYWAIPMVKVMKKSKLITKFWNHVMSNRTKDIKWRLKKGKFNLLGRLYSMLIENGSYVVGKLIKNKKTKEVLA